MPSHKAIFIQTSCLNEPTNLIIMMLNSRRNTIQSYVFPKSLIMAASLEHNGLIQQRILMSHNNIIWRAWDELLWVHTESVPYTQLYKQLCSCAVSTSSTISNSFWTAVFHTGPEQLVDRAPGLVHSTFGLVNRPKYWTDWASANFVNIFTALC